MGCRYVEHYIPDEKHKDNELYFFLKIMGKKKQNE